MRCFIFLLVLSLFTLFNGNSAAQPQSHNYRGNLVKINMTAKSVNLSDTLGNWYDAYDIKSSGQYNEASAYYYDHLTLPGHSYFLKQSHSEIGPYIQMYWSGDIIENESHNNERTFNTAVGGWCGMLSPLTILKTEVIPAGQGAWLINGSLGNAFIYNNDSLITLFSQYNHQPSQSLAENLVAVLGKVSERYLAVFNYGYSNYEYRLVDLSNSPEISEGSSSVVRFYGFPNDQNQYIGFEQPLFRRTKKICDNLYLFQSDHIGGLHLFSFNDTCFTYIKSLSGDNYLNAGSTWDLRNNKLHLDGILTYDLNISDTTFVNRRELPRINNSGTETSIDRDLKYEALIDGDTLRIYDINKECYINAISIKGINKPFRPIIDYPYVYLHQTIVEENSSILAVEENNSAVKSYNLSAYPNPFNPATTLEFNIPAEGRVELKIYDALGKEVTTLVNEVKKEGIYKVQFIASSLPSGIYLCRMNAGKYSVTKKIVLLK
ncbi:MAG: T9SS type A sorting domain-containing protein [Bacillota bacterium]